MPLILVLGRLRQTDLGEFKAGMVYIVSSMPARVPQKDCVSKIKINTKIFKKPGLVAQICNASAGELEAGGFLGFTGQPSQPNWQAQDPSERHCLTRQSRWLLRKTAEVALWPSYICTYNQTHTYTTYRLSPCACVCVCMCVHVCVCMCVCAWREIRSYLQRAVLLHFSDILPQPFQHHLGLASFRTGSQDCIVQ